MMTALDRFAWRGSIRWWWNAKRLGGDLVHIQKLEQPIDRHALREVQLTRSCEK